MRGACYDNKLISRYDKLLPINIIQRQAKKVASSASEREREIEKEKEQVKGEQVERERESERETAKLCGDTPTKPQYA